MLYFPVTYIISDVLTEVYGYAKARSVLWTVMFCSITAGLIYQLVILFSSPPEAQNSEAYHIVLGAVPRVLLGGWIAVFTGDILNNYMLAKMKILTNGKYLWTRIIGSTIVGQFVNTTCFYGIALSGILPISLLIKSILVGWFFKVIVEVIFTPITYMVVHFLKKAEEEDFYDRDTNFNPLIFDPKL